MLKMNYYKILFTDEAKNYLKSLQGKLIGLRSIRAAGQRYRIIFKVERSQVVVIIVAIGIRKEGSKDDIYHLISK